jgi:Protein of unknown function (DUF2505)
MTPFCFEHVFQAPSTAAVFAGYFDAEHQIDQDHNMEILEREIIELVDDGATLRRVCRAVPRRQLPTVIRPFLSGPLHYLETVIWDRAADLITIDIRPSLMRGRVQIVGTYRLERVGPHSILRRYSGEVSVDIALISARIERGIVQEFEKSMPIAATCTQRWLDRQIERSVAARA